LAVVAPDATRLFAVEKLLDRLLHASMIVANVDGDGVPRQPPQG